MRGWIVPRVSTRRDTSETIIYKTRNSCESSSSNEINVSLYLRYVIETVNPQHARYWDI